MRYSLLIDLVSKILFANLDVKAIEEGLMFEERQIAFEAIDEISKIQGNASSLSQQLYQVLQNAA